MVRRIIRAFTVSVGQTARHRRREYCRVDDDDSDPIALAGIDGGQVEILADEVRRGPSDPCADVSVSLRTSLQKEVQNLFG
jgi:hypothetical protein